MNSICYISITKLRVILLMGVSVFCNLKYRSSTCVPSMIHCKIMAADENAVLFHQCPVILFLVKESSYAVSNFD
jgi:hypothetical protein